MEKLYNIFNVKNANKQYIIITTPDLKRIALNYRNDNRIIDRNKLMTENEFIEGFIFKSEIDNLKILIENNPWSNEYLNVNTAKLVEKTLNLISILKLDTHPLYSYLQEVEEIGFTLAKNNIPSSYEIIGYLPRTNDLLHAILPSINFQVLNANISKKIYKFDYFLDEIEASIEYILKQLDSGVDINTIHLFMPSEYQMAFKQIASVYNLPIESGNEFKLFSHPNGRDAYEQFIEKGTIDFERINPLLIDAILDIVNKYVIYNNISDYKMLIKDDFKNKTVNLASNGGLKINTKINSLYSECQFEADHFVLLGNYQDGLITYHKDIELISDEYRTNILNTNQKNNNEDYLLHNIVTNAKNLFISFSTIISDKGVMAANNVSNLNVVKCEPLAISKFSKKHDELKFARSNYLKQTYNVKSDRYNKLSKYYIAEQKTNTFAGVNRSYDNMVLSYTSINDYAKCGYKFYLSHVLRIKNGKFDNRKMIFGNIVHSVLEKINLVDSVDSISKEIIESYKVQELDISAVDLIYINKYAMFLEQLVIEIKQEELEANFSQVLRENKFEMDINDNVKLIGAIDKVMINMEANNLFVEIYDYKTGSITINMNDIEFGLNMQNLIYFLLIRNYYKYEDGEEVLLGTFQQQVKYKQLYDNQTHLDNQQIKGYSLKKNKNVIKRSEKVITTAEIDEKLVEVERQIKRVVDEVEKNNFEINPKIVDGKNISCGFCPYISICNVKHENKVYLNRKKEGK